MDLNDIKKARMLLYGNLVPPVANKTLKDLLPSSCEPKQRNILEDILDSCFIGRIYKKSLLITKDFIRTEIESHISKRGMNITEFKCHFDRIDLTISSKKWFVSMLEPEMHLKFTRLRLNQYEQWMEIEYNFENFFYDFALKNAANIWDIEAVTILEQTDSGGKIKLDLSRYISDYDKRTCISSLSCSIFEIVSFSNVIHSDEGVIIKCDMDDKAIVESLCEKIRIVEEQNSQTSDLKSNASVWMIHKDQNT